MNLGIRSVTYMICVSCLQEAMVFIQWDSSTLFLLSLSLSYIYNLHTKKPTLHALECK